MPSDLLRFDDEMELEAGWRLDGQDGAGQRVQLSLGETELRQAYLGVTIGRHPHLCELLIDDPTVSRRHFRLSLGTAGLLVEDVHSLNGTIVDGLPLTPFLPVVLHDGQVLTIGRVNLTVSRLAGRGAD